jgi:hypothetical protein
MTLFQFSKEISLKFRTIFPCNNLKLMTHFFIEFELIKRLKIKFKIVYAKLNLAFGQRRIFCKIKQNKN